MNHQMIAIDKSKEIGHDGADRPGRRDHFVRNAGEPGYPAGYQAPGPDQFLKFRDRLPVAVLDGSHFDNLVIPRAEAGSLQVDGDEIRLIRHLMPDKSRPGPAGAYSFPGRR